MQNTWAVTRESPATGNSHASARDKGYVTTLMGRRRFLPAINARDRVSRQGAERMALNTPIQGTAADIIKLAMLKVDEAVSKEFPEARMILQVHDELMFEARKRARKPWARGCAISWRT